MTTVTAFVGATGGAGTTRLAVECATLCAHRGTDVAVLDLALDTQGLASYTSASLAPDLTAVLTDGAAIDQALVSLTATGSGTVTICPTRASIERIADAKRDEAASRLTGVFDQLSREYDLIFLDIPPVVHNLALAGLTAADHRVVVTPATQRGADALRRMEGRFRDLGCDITGVVATFADTSDPVHRADVAIPRFDATAPDAIPSVLGPDTSHQSRLAEILSVTGIDSTLTESPSSP